MNMMPVATDAYVMILRQYFQKKKKNVTQPGARKAFKRKRTPSLVVSFSWSAKIKNKHHWKCFESQYLVHKTSFVVLVGIHSNRVVFELLIWPCNQRCARWPWSSRCRNPQHKVWRSLNTLMVSPQQLVVQLKTDSSG